MKATVKATSYLKAAEKCKKMMEAVDTIDKLIEIDKEYTVTHILLKAADDGVVYSADDPKYVDKNDEILTFSIEGFGYGRWVYLDYPSYDRRDYSFEFMLYDYEQSYPVKDDLTIDYLKRLGDKKIEISDKYKEV